MVKINFEDMTFFVDVERKTAVRRDVKKQIANDLYNHGRGIWFHALALKIYNSHGETEYTDEEYQLLLDFSNETGTPVFIDAITAVKAGISNNGQK